MDVLAKGLFSLLPHLRGHRLSATLSVARSAASLNRINPVPKTGGQRSFVAPSEPKRQRAFAPLTTLDQNFRVLNHDQTSAVWTRGRSFRCPCTLDRKGDCSSPLGTPSHQGGTPIPCS